MQKKDVDIKNKWDEWVILPTVVFKILFLFALLQCERVSCLHIFLCTTYVPGVLEGQKRESDSLELELVSGFEVLCRC